MKGGMILAGCGTICLILSLAVFAICLLLPIANQGRIGWNEAAFGFVPSGCCSGLSFLLVLGGIIWMIVGRKPATIAGRRPDGPRG